MALGPIVMVKDTFRWDRYGDHLHSIPEWKTGKLQDRYYFARQVGRVSEDIFLVGIGLEDDWQPAVADWTPGRYRLRPRSLLRFPLGAPEGSEQPKWLGQKVLTLSMREDSVVAIFADPVSASRPIAALSADIKSRIGSTMTDSWYAADELAAQLGVDRLEASSDDIPISQSADYVIEAAHKDDKSNAAGFVSGQISCRFIRLSLLRRYSGAGVTVAAFPNGQQVLVTIDIDPVVNRSGVLKAQSTTPMSVVAYTPKISQIVQIYSQSNDKRYVITSDLRVLPRSDVIFEDGKSRSDREKSVWLKSDATLWSALFSSNQKKAGSPVPGKRRHRDFGWLYPGRRVLDGPTDDPSKIKLASPLVLIRVYRRFQKNASLSSKPTQMTDSRSVGSSVAPRWPRDRCHPAPNTAHQGSESGAHAVEIVDYH